MIYELLNKDIMLDDLNYSIKADCMYVDPPWGIGNLRYWRTINNQMDHEVDWIQFLKRLKIVAHKHVGLCRPMFIETGKRFVEDVEGVFDRASEKFTVLYKSGNKKFENILLVFNHNVGKDVTCFSGIDLVYTCLASVKRANTVFDPCVGTGLTAKACKRLNLNLLCNELNINRLRKTSKILGVKI